MSKFVDEYLKWLKDNIIENQLDNCLEITTPFLDRHNDWLQIYVEEFDNNIRITDDGYILEDLISCGLDLNTPTRKKLLSKITAGYGVKISDTNELYIIATPNTFPQSKHALIQCMMSVNDLYITSKSNTLSIFADDIKDFLYKNDIQFMENISFTGQSGFTNKFDFGIPKFKNRKETLIKGINNPTKDNISLSLFQWEDTKKVREPDTQLILYLNDTKIISDNLTSSCTSYGVIPIQWSQKKESLKYLKIA